MRLCVFALFGLFAGVAAVGHQSSEVRLIFVSSAENDVLLIAQEAASKNSVSVFAIDRFDTVDDALGNATLGDGLLLMADNMRNSAATPQTNTTVNVTSAQWSRMASLGRFQSLVGIKMIIKATFLQHT